MIGVRTLAVQFPLRPGRWLRAALGALLPSTCALCGQACGDVVCAGCETAYAQAHVARCGCCANPLASLDPRLRGDDERSLRGGDERSPRGGGDSLCGACLRERPPFDATVAAVDYAAPLDQLVLGLKFGARLPLAAWCARMLRDAALATPGLPLPDLLCPVPLGPARLVERGYNQAQEIARPLAAALGVALHPRLAARIADTPAQSGVAPADRARNVRGAFVVLETELVAGRHVGLVDDVMTSGHTLAALASACKQAGATRVTNFVFARTPPRMH